MRNLQSEKGDYKDMFASPKFYIIVSNNSFIIKKEGSNSENIIHLESFIPNVPAYHHLFDTDKKGYTEDITKQIKGLKIKNAAIICADDAIDIELDKKILTEYFLQSGVKKVEINPQCFFLNLESKKYIAISKTTRTIVMQYIAYKQSISKKYYDKAYDDLERIKSDMKYLHADCEYDMIPVFINNINNDMDSFKAIGNLVSQNDFTVP
jgi:hypothetical protein